MALLYHATRYVCEETATRLINQQAMLTIESISRLNEYINGVMDRANHHAQNVNEVALTIAGAVVWRATDDIEVRSNNSAGTGNMLWFFVGEDRYVLAYHHKTGEIELKERNSNGAVIASFSNSWTAAQVKTVFAGL